MKKLKAWLVIIFPVMGLSFLTSCEKDQFKLINVNLGYLVAYKSDPDFKLGNPTPTKFEHTHMQGFNDGHGSPFTSYGYVYDARNEDGWSNWSDPGFLDQSFFRFDEYTRAGNYPDQLYFSTTFVVDWTLDTPPAHLHLCLEKWDQEHPQAERLGRTWKVQSIKDEAGNDLTTDPDWENYKDNTMRFEKHQDFVFVPGPLRSAKEEELFGIYPENEKVYGSYSLTKDDKPILSLVFPEFKRQLTIEESDWGHIKLKGTENGKTGYLELGPAN